MGDTLRLTGTLINLDRHGRPFGPGTVVRTVNAEYQVQSDGSMRRVQDVTETADGVRFRRLRSTTKAEKKALKRQRAKQRADLAAAALRVARRVVGGHQESHA